MTTTSSPAAAVSRISLGGDGTAWTLTDVSTGATLGILPPVFEIDGADIVCRADLAVVSERALGNGAIETIASGVVSGETGLELRLVVRTAADNPIVRFRYELADSVTRRLTKRGGESGIRYAAVARPDAVLTEVRLSDWVEQGHSFLPQETRIARGAAEALSPFVGPLVVGEETETAWVLGYEHGSSGSDQYIGFWVSPAGDVTVRSVKGAYLDGQSLHGQGISTPWLHAGIVPGTIDDVASVFRDFVLRYQSENLESRRTNITYNTWNYQERQCYWQGNGYTGGFTEDWVRQDIEVAARLGVDIYVIDAGWFAGTGDWGVDPVRFPGGLTAVTARIRELGMKVGMWFDPTKAALSSAALSAHRGDVKTVDGVSPAPRRIWETEESLEMCIASDWLETFVGHCVRFHEEHGVTYFKMDAVDQHGCDSPHHLHGDESHSPEEREARFSFLVGERIVEIGSRLHELVPGSIVEFDVTEKDRSFGLSWPSVGRYSIINNGPYYSEYGLPADLDGVNTNIFFAPDVPRGWIVRAPLAFDRWIPSVVTLAYWFPDEPRELQNEQLASLLLGQNGVWGDLLALSREGIGHFRETIDRYRTVAADAARAPIITTGRGQGAHEVRERVFAPTGRGVVSVFPRRGQRIRFVTTAPVDGDAWTSDGVEVRSLPDGHALVESSVAGFVVFGSRRSSSGPSPVRHR